MNCSLTSEFALVQENILLQNEKITQLYVIQSEQNPFLWFAVLFVDHGIFKGCVIRFSIFIEETYPDCSCPKIVFDPIPPHPLVNPFTGELDTKNAFQDWNSQTRRLFELLLFVKRVIHQADEYIDLIGGLLNAHKRQHDVEQRTIYNNNEYAYQESSTVPQQDHLLASAIQNPSTIKAISADKMINYDGDPAKLCQISDFNPRVTSLFSWFHHTLEFFKIYNNNPEKLRKLLDEFKEKCAQQLLDKPALCGDDRNAIVFSPWDIEIHEPLRKCVLAGRFTPTSLFATYHKETESVAFIPGHDNT